MPAEIRSGIPKTQHKRLTDRIPIVEIYGPVIQGEGALAGHPTIFVRSGGCDFRCNHCDSMHAVDGTEIKKRSVLMNNKEIANTVIERYPITPWVTLSGGNPCLWDYSIFIAEMREVKKKVAVETQGTYWKNWLTACQIVTVSPKGPTMLGNGEGQPLRGLDIWHYRLAGHRGFSFKIVCFSEADVAYAREVHSRYPSIPFYLSVGNSWILEQDLDLLRNLLFERYDWLCNAVMSDPILGDAIVLPQIHAVTYGNAEGI